MSRLSNPIFHDKQAAREWLEARVWPNGPVCHHCGIVGEAAQMKCEATRPGRQQGNARGKSFTVTMGARYESSRVPLHIWRAVIHLMMPSKKGISVLQVSRMIGKPQKIVWSLRGRIRESPKASPDPPSTGGHGNVLEADEAHIGGKAKHCAHREPAPRQAGFNCGTWRQRPLVPHAPSFGLRLPLRLVEFRNPLRRRPRSR